MKTKFWVYFLLFVVVEVSRRTKNSRNTEKLQKSKFWINFPLFL